MPVSAEQLAALLLDKLERQNERLAILAREARRIARRCPLPSQEQS